MVDRCPNENCLFLKIQTRLTPAPMWIQLTLTEHLLGTQKKGKTMAAITEGQYPGYQESHGAAARESHRMQRCRVSPSLKRRRWDTTVSTAGPWHWELGSKPKDGLRDPKGMSSPKKGNVQSLLHRQEGKGMCDTLRTQTNDE